ncbi:MAG: GWxTD domain-containing protein [Bacteroidota bacterium]
MSRLFLFLCLVCASALTAQQASLSFARFTSQETPYVELYLHFEATSLTSQPVTDSTSQRAVEVLVTFSQKNKVQQFDKFRLLSPVAAEAVDFIDVKRYGLPPGDYELEVVITDGTDPTRTKSYKSPLALNFATDRLAQSDIQLLANIENTVDLDHSMVKNGVRMEPLPFNYYGRGRNTLSFYHELYGSDQYIGQPFVVSYRIDRLDEDAPTTVLIGHKRQEPATVNPILVQMDISTLASGDYKLVVEARNRERELLSTRETLFRRSNPFYDAVELDQAMSEVNIQEEFVGALTAAELEYGLRALTPLLPSPDVEKVAFAFRDNDLLTQRETLYRFWLNENRANPKAAYEEFMEVARAVDDEFDSGFRHGFETDRGYVYLKYGRPTNIVRQENEPSAPPYEIWSYNEVKLTMQNNVRFIFYNPSLAAEDFILLHSDVRGERQNPRWEVELYRDSPTEGPDDYFGGEEVRDNIGRRARRLLDDY